MTVQRKRYLRFVVSESVWVSVVSDRLQSREPCIEVMLDAIAAVLAVYSNGFGNWYRRFNRQYVTDDPKKVFHSMCHTVADTLKQAGVPEVVISEILGHTHSSITSGRYGKRY